MKQKLNNLIIISIVIVIILILLFLYIKVYKTDSFDNLESTNTSFPNTSTTKAQPIDRTQLYGALFLENLDKTIKNLSNPDIQYEEKRIQLNNYIDILH
jgi:hypothetical protein